MLRKRLQDLERNVNFFSMRGHISHYLLAQKELKAFVNNLSDEDKRALYIT